MSMRWIGKNNMNQERNKNNFCETICPCGNKLYLFELEIKQCPKCYRVIDDLGIVIDNKNYQSYNYSRVS